ncbi:hypothetical protein N7476_006161 [Penicillium atrosanguineum]|uniref:Phytanoyl-CoA dioxygenase family protein n=1 Tax=Penicillium atrosanguineum TaxID=1132637 RepID=A0A9W9PWT5_9EURO|nr:hypothetical protein N7476_006161 [Penicillium atrosanguineum]
MASDKATITRVPFADAAGLIEVLTRDGCVIATGFTPPECLTQVQRDVSPYMEGYTEIRKELFPPEYRWCGGIFGRSDTVRNRWLAEENLNQVCDHFLKTTCTPPGGYDGATFETKPVLAFSVTLDIGPGAQQQPLHRDDYLYFHTHRDLTQTGYQVGADMMILMFVPGVETTIENGATLVVPGSHLWDDVRTPTDQEICYAVMSPGEALFVLGSTWHAGGANKTKDVRRPQNTFFFTRGMYRPEENPYLTYLPHEVLGWSEKSQALAGMNRDTLAFDRTNYLVPSAYYAEAGKKPTIE